MVSILQLLLLIFFLNQDDSLYFMIFLWLLYYVYVVFFDQESWSVSGWVILSAFICCHFLYVKNLHIIAWFICMANRNKILNQLNHAKLFFLFFFNVFIFYLLNSYPNLWVHWWVSLTFTDLMIFCYLKSIWGMNDCWTSWRKRFIHLNKMKRNWKLRYTSSM